MRYKRVPFKKAWRKTADLKPHPDDLVCLKKDSFSPTIIGWWSGTHWEGLKITPTDKFELWKPKSVSDFTI